MGNRSTYNIRGVYHDTCKVYFDARVNSAGNVISFHGLGIKSVTRVQPGIFRTTFGIPSSSNSAGTTDLYNGCVEYNLECDVVSGTTLDSPSMGLKKCFDNVAASGTFDWYFASGTSGPVIPNQTMAVTGSFELVRSTFHKV